MLPGSSRKLGLSKLNMAGMGSKLMRTIMRNKQVIWQTAIQLVPTRLYQRINNSGCLANRSTDVQKLFHQFQNILFAEQFLGQAFVVVRL
ncbi:MAG: hypothetical protein BWX77_00968 [Bacteroidetes bacterium ADurb.Bin090]|jgi:hypothetical protein|nr:MAG: hypothetical protein BWX77_00968 [Bacteroidetes bacterium ADurb.Bin090]